MSNLKQQTLIQQLNGQLFSYYTIFRQGFCILDFQTSIVDLTSLISPLMVLMMVQ